jgi:hypothetical protein
MDVDIGCACVVMCLPTPLERHPNSSHLDKTTHSRASEACMPGLLGGLSRRVHGIWQVGTITIAILVRSVHVVVGREDAGVGVLWSLVGKPRHKQASRSHCNINQSCSALPQTETFLIRADRLRHLGMRRPHLFVTTHRTG